MAETEENTNVTEELELIAGRLREVKASGFGSVHIQIADHKVVNIKFEVSQAIKKN